MTAPNTLRCLATQRSADGSIKFLWQTTDGAATFESIYVTFPAAPQAPSPQQRKEQAFLCLSSQDGCNVGCRFCATGLQRMRRNLTAAEMIARVEQGLALVRTVGNPATRLYHVAFAGMGEPLMNT